MGPSSLARMGMEEKEVRNHYKLGSKSTPPLKRAVDRSPKKRHSYWVAAVILTFIILGGIFTTYSFSDTTPPSAKPPAKKELEKPSETPHYGRLYQRKLRKKST